MKRKTRLILSLLSFLLMTSFVLVGCNENNETDTTGSEDNSEDGNKYSKEDNPIVTIEMENGDVIKAELYSELASNTVNNFISLINKGYYDGLIFHRVIPEFMIQGGDPKGDGTGGPDYGIVGEFESNGIENDLKHSKGVLSMARSGNPNSAGSQFFIMAANSPHLDGDYAGFGKVIEGIEVIDKIVDSERDNHDKPLEPQTMKKVTVDLKGKTYEEPDTIE